MLTENLSQKWISFVQLLEGLSPTQIRVLVGIGLIVRLVGCLSLGDADTESFKSWALLMHSKGIAGTYGPPDAELFQRMEEKGISFTQAFNETRYWQQWIPLKNYWRNRYMAMYPPVSNYVSWLSGKAYHFVTGSFENRRLYHFFINFPMVVFTGLLCLTLYYFFRFAGLMGAKAVALIFWCNPIVILDSPLLGFNNIVIALISTLALVAFYKKSYAWAVFWTVLGFWTKPQGIVFLPLAAIVLLREVSFRKLVWLAGLALLVSCVLIFPFLIKGAAMSALWGSMACVRGLDEWSEIAMSWRTWNVWWMVDFICKRLVPSASPFQTFHQGLGIKAEAVGFFCYLLLILGSVARCYRSISTDRMILFRTWAAIGISYNLIAINVQFNQFFLFVSPLVVLIVAYQREAILPIALILMSGLQMLFYTGIGRDLPFPCETFIRSGYGRPVLAFEILCSMINILLMGVYLYRFLLHQVMPTSLSRRLITNP